VALTRDAIVEVALRHLDEHGLDALSLRKVAAELGVSAPTLYWYVNSKRELLDLMAVALFSRTRDNSGHGVFAELPWWEAFEHRSRSIYLSMIEHRDSARVVAGNRPTASVLAGVEFALSHLVNAGFTPAQAQQALLAIGAYIGGSALEWQGERDRAESGVSDEALLAELSDSDRYPTLAAAVRSIEFHNPLHTFDFGLKALITGLRTMVESA
jgi:TetR/AcrR family tetracycline transcriptional repressor